MTAILPAAPRPARPAVALVPAATYEQRLTELALADERIIVMTAENRAAIRGLPAKLGPRFLDTGITEQTMVGMGAGLALQGRVPVMHALAAFLTMRAYEFIRTDIGIARLPAKLVGAVAGVLSEANGPTHQAIEDVALMRTIPGMSIFCPADTRELLNALPAILAHPGPSYVRYIDRPPVTASAPPFVFGRAHVITPGRDIAILSYGAMLREAFDAAVVLEAAGLSVSLIDVRSLEPVDEEAILDAAIATKMLVTIEDHIATGGLATIVAERLVAHGATAHLLPINLGRAWFTPGLLPDVLRAAGLASDQLATRIQDHFVQLPLD